MPSEFLRIGDFIIVEDPKLEASQQTEYHVLRNPRRYALVSFETLEEAQGWVRDRIRQPLLAGEPEG